METYTTSYYVFKLFGIPLFTLETGIYTAHAGERYTEIEYSEDKKPELPKEQPAQPSQP